MLRGLSDGTFTGRTQQTVGTYLDNIPLTYNAPDPDLRLIDVDRVEVLRGPQGALYGGGSLSGVYRIVTTKPVLNVWSGSVLAGAAATESGSPSSRLEGVLNLPLVADRPPSGWRPIATSTAAMSTTSTCACRTSTAPRAPAGRAACRWWSIRTGRSWCPAPPGPARHRQPVHDPQPGRPEARQPGARDPRQRPAAGRGDDHRLGDWGRFVSSTGYVTPPLRQPVRRHRRAERRRLGLGRRRPVRRGQQGAAAGRGRGAVVARHRPLPLAVRPVRPGQPRGQRRRAAGAHGYDPSRLVYLEDPPDRRRELALYGETAYDLGGGWTVSLGGRAFRSEVHTTSTVEAPPRASRATWTARRASRASRRSSRSSATWRGGGLVYC
jgi:iron complex outermembrane receptor protein